MRKNSVKNIRINSEVQKEMSLIIREDLKDPRINPMTSVMAVEVTPDLKFAKIFVSVLGDEESKKKTMEGLKKSASYARHQLASRMNLRNTPEITFVLDESIEYGVTMSKKIEDVKKRDLAKHKDEEVYE
ncbi:MAG: 30S ribosome-binding factor RbfA [Eubacterium sp.]|nr:30S ribosome-binding factor RbfA [Eubacterium sp.]